MLIITVTRPLDAFKYLQISIETGEATVTFPCKYEGADLEIGFNPAFLVEALKVVDSDDISLELSAANRPGLLKGGPNFLYVIMPVNLQ